MRWEIADDNKFGNLPLSVGAGPEQRTGQRCVSESEFCAPTGGRAGGWARRRARVSSAAPTHHNDAGADQEQLHHVYQQLDLILFVVVVRGLHSSELVGNHHPQSSGMQPILQRPRLRVPTEAARQTVAKLPRARGLRQELRDDCIDVHDTG